MECAKRVFNLLLDKTKIKKLVINLLRVFKTMSFKRKEKYNLDNPSINNNLYESVQQAYDISKLEMYDIIKILFDSYNTVSNMYVYDTLIDKIIDSADSPKLIRELNELVELSSFLRDFTPFYISYYFH